MANPERWMMRRRILYRNTTTLRRLHIQIGCNTHGASLGLKPRSEIHEQVLKIERDPAECQTRKVPFQDELFRDVALEVHLGIDIIHTCIDILFQITVQSFLALLHAETQYAEIDVARTTNFGKFCQQGLCICDERGHVGRGWDEASQFQQEENRESTLCYTRS